MRENKVRREAARITAYVPRVPGTFDASPRWTRLGRRLTKITAARLDEQREAWLDTLPNDLLPAAFVLLTSP